MQAFPRNPSRRHRQWAFFDRPARLAGSGFTLIELMVTIGLAAILMSFAAPALMDFVVKNRMAGLTNEFTGTVLRARSEAIQRNTCTAMCVSSNANSGTPTCDNVQGKVDWARGWLLYVDADCDASTAFAAADLLAARAGDEARYTLESGSAALTFWPRGYVSGFSTFSLVYDQNGSAPHNRDIVVNMQGRTVVRAP